jgi:lauroyl/myristoyl acyltransferase
MFRYRLEYAALRFVVFIVNLLPLFFINWLTSSLGWLVWVVFPFRLPVAYYNISTVFPSMSHQDRLRIIKKAYRQFFHAAGLILVIHRKKMSRMIDEAQISGLDLLDSALSEKKGVILTTYHGCWFEAYFAWFSRGSRPTSLIYQQQSNPLCDAFFVRQRQRYGTNLQHLHSLEKLQVYRNALNQGKILIISLDQNYTDNGTLVTMFNKEFVCARGAALLHLKTRAPVLTSVYYLKGRRLHIDFERVDLPHYNVIDDHNIQEISNLSIKKYEKTIASYPDQWFSLFHRLWQKQGYSKKIKRSLGDIFFLSD